MQWEELESCVKLGQLSRLSRTTEGQQTYRDHTHHVRQEWATIGDYIRHTKLGLPSKRNDDGLLIIDDDHKDHGQSIIVLLPNDFPYDLETEIRHDLLWSPRELSSNEIEEHLECVMSDRQYVYFINPPALMTIPSVWHCHVMSKPLN